MISLLIDTAPLKATIALTKGEDVIDVMQIENKHDLSEKLLIEIEKILSRNQIAKKSIQKIYVGIGPGSFTGIRIGVTVAKTLAFACSIPLIPISSLEVMATTNCNTDYIAPIMDARRDYVYAGIYTKEMEIVYKDSYINIEELKSKLSDKEVTYVSYDKLDVEPLIEPNIQVEKILLKHKEDRSCNPHKCIPIYLKKTEAEENLKHD